jgi:hypothetical protein
MEEEMEPVTSKEVKMKWLAEKAETSRLQEYQAERIEELKKELERTRWSNDNLTKELQGERNMRTALQNDWRKEEKEARRTLARVVKVNTGANRYYPLPEGRR